MADPATKHKDNAPGKYYIDETCTFCAVCIDEAPNNIRESEDGDHAVIFKQPENPEEEEQMRAALEGCPTESLGDDGE
ncbi:MAG: ferredoxin [bacterium]|jgi:ferredoxin